ncbi:MAG: hypothetical protein GY941_23960 [Planctomycetes bacterium]|nr:hypothetical protein [Planctomycetota bacterium]
MANNKTANKEATQLVDRAKELLYSREGKNNIKEALKQAGETATKYDKAQFIDPKSLNEPFTI